MRFLMALGKKLILRCSLSVMNISKLSCALLLLLSIISPSCDSKPKPAPTEQAPAEQTPAEQATTDQNSSEAMPTEQATAETSEPSEMEPTSSDESLKTLTILSALYGTG
ncbi:MAG: hypothetical protein ACO3GO_07940, partial [Terrimicrobiaceae bacterium]